MKKTIKVLALCIGSISCFNAQLDIELVKEFNSTDQVKYIVNFDNKIFFSANDGINGNELWSSDGSIAGTLLFKDLLAGSQSSSPEHLTVFGDKMYFIAKENASTKALFVSDGTSNGTIKLTSLSSNFTSIDAAIYFGNLNGTIFFKNDLGGTGQELWKTDGTILGTSLVKDINIGAFDSNPDYFFTYHNVCYFNAKTNNFGNELWRTDGTGNGTYQVVDGMDSQTSMGPRDMFEFNDRIFYEYDGELWSSDGTDVGTTLFKQINNFFPSDPRNFMIYNNKMYFSAKRNGLAHELFICDGTIEGTVPVLDFMNGYFAGSLTNFNSRIFYSGSTDAEGQELWVSDGTNSGTNLFKNFNPENNNTANGLEEQAEMLEVDGVLYFVGTDHGQFKELFRTTGALNQTFKFTYDFSLTDDGQPKYLTSFNSKLYYSAAYLNNGGLYIVGDGTLKTKEETSNDLKVSVYPNPAKDEITVHFKEEKVDKVEIYNCLGSLIVEDNIENSASQKQISYKLERGIYFVKISNLHNNSSIKVIVE